MPSVGGGKGAGAAGKRDRYVQIQKRQPIEQSDAGQPIEPWACLNYAWMSRNDMSADERFGQDQESAHGDTRWVMPYQSDMDPERIDLPADRRLSYLGRIYDILSATPLGWKRDIEIVTLSRTG